MHVTALIQCSDVTLQSSIALQCRIVAYSAIHLEGEINEWYMKILLWYFAVTLNSYFLEGEGGSHSTVVAHWSAGQWLVTDSASRA